MSLENINKDFRMSIQSDIIMSTAWVIGFLIPILDIYLLYKLIKRRNEHFHTQSLLREDLMKFIQKRAEAKGAKVELDSLERAFREDAREEAEKGAALWAILSLATGIAVLYVFYFLMKDFYGHEKREDAFWETIATNLGLVGVSFTLPVPTRRNLLPQRSFAKYLVLTIITLGIFAFYWVYILIRDPNEHFREHRNLESQLSIALEASK